MIMRLFLSITAGCALVVLYACFDAGDGGADQPPQTAAANADPLAALNIQTATAQAAGAIPLGSVPGQITLPPEARVAVTSPYPGGAVRIFVIEGQSVTRGQPLALVRASEPVQIRGDLARAQAELGLADARAKRLDQLASEGIIAQARADEARAALASARASVAQSQRLAALAGAGADGTMTLRAPISGRVAHVAVETGGPVDTMTAPFVIENPSAYYVDLQLPERLARAVRPGMAVEIALGGDGGQAAMVGGQILSVAPSIDPMTRSVMARASLGAAAGLVAGQNVMVVISGPAQSSGSGSGGVSVPSSAVTRIGGKDHVFVKTGKNFTARPVMVAATAGGRSVISDGLEAGAVVATSSITELKSIAAE